MDRVRVRALKNAEDARFRDDRPKSAALLERGLQVMPNGVPMSWMVGSYHHLPLWVAEGKGAHFTDVDGHEYRDFNIADLSMFCGYAPEPLVRAVSDRIARGNQFMLPVEDAIVVSEELGAAIRAADVAVHELRDPRQHRGHPRGAGRDRPRPGPDVRRQVPRPPRRGAGRARRGGRRSSPRSAGSRATRSAARSSSRSTTRRPSPASSSGATSRSSSRSPRSPTTSASCCPTTASTPSSGA